MITQFPGGAADVAHELPAAHIVNEQVVDDFVHLFKLLADDTRMRIVLYLSRKSEMHVRALCKHLHQSQPAVSHHLALLRVAGLIKMRRQGRHNFYALRPQRFRKMLRLLSALVKQQRAQRNGRRLELATA
jgi:ArsR family transcriptional regulator